MMLLVVVIHVALVQCLLDFLGEESEVRCRRHNNTGLCCSCSSRCSGLIFRLHLLNSFCKCRSLAARLWCSLSMAAALEVVSQLK